MVSTSTSNSKSSSDAVKVIFNGEPIGYVLVEHIMFVPNDDDSYNPNNDYESWHKTISALDSDYIKTEFIDKGDIDYHAVNEMSFKIEKGEGGGFLTYEARDDLGLVKMEMIPISHITNFHIGRSKEGLLLQQRQTDKIYKLSKDEKRKGR